MVCTLSFSRFLSISEIEYRVWLGIVEEYAGGHDQGNQAGNAIVLRRREDNNAYIFHGAGGCPPIRIVFPGSTRRATNPRLRIFYLQDSAVTPLRIIDTDVTPGLWRLFRSKSRKSAHDDPKPTISIFLASTNEAGYFPSSLYPPIGEGHGVTHRAPLPYSNVIDILDCQGPHNSTFYSIFASDRENGFAMRVHVRWGGKAETYYAYEISLCKLNGLHGAGLERFCDTRIGANGPTGKGYVQWQQYINLLKPSTYDAGHPGSLSHARNVQSLFVGLDRWTSSRS
jgi:hypothetical protein